MLLCNCILCVFLLKKNQNLLPLTALPVSSVHMHSSLPSLQLTKLSTSWYYLSDCHEHLLPERLHILMRPEITTWVTHQYGILIYYSCTMKGTCGVRNRLKGFFFSNSLSLFYQQRALEPPEVRHERLFVVSVLGFIVNLVGIFAFHHGQAHGHSHSCK